MDKKKKGVAEKKPAKKSRPLKDLRRGTVTAEQARSVKGGDDPPPTGGDPTKIPPPP